ncbi:MAG: DNA gyrase inhibitor YacG [Gammaproteobacteria bacterium]|nr:DNA gyrase inhibitor YacG [Gammaproteobacteria bacterium]
MSEPVRILPCPTCRKPVKWSPANRFRPFCSERCRLIDFGGWADERYRIEGDPSFDDVPSDGVDGE